MNVLLSVVFRLLYFLSVAICLLLMFRFLRANLRRQANASNRICEYLKNMTVVPGEDKRKS